MEDTKRAGLLWEANSVRPCGGAKKSRLLWEAALLLTNLSIDEDFTLQRLAIHHGNDHHLAGFHSCHFTVAVDGGDAAVLGAPLDGESVPSTVMGTTGSPTLIENSVWATPLLL